MARTRHHEPVAVGGTRLLAIWAVVGPTVGLLLGLLIGYAAWGAKEPEPRTDKEAQRRALPSSRPTPHKTVVTTPELARPEAKSPVAERTWFAGRGLPAPQLAYLFSNDATTLKPAAGAVANDRLALQSTGSVRLTPAGASISDGGKLMSREAGVALSTIIRKSGAFSVEALVRPRDTRHRGPARIVSLSYNGSLRNFTLAQEDSNWVVRLRTERTDPNGVRNQQIVSGLRAEFTHVMVTYNGKAERTYLNGRLSATNTKVAGSLDSWDAAMYPLVVGNEAHEARNWAGTVRFLAVYSAALDREQVALAARSLPPAAKTASPAAGGGDVF